MTNAHTHHQRRPQRYRIVRLLRTTPVVQSYEAVHPSMPGAFKVDVVSGLPGAAQAALEADLVPLLSLRHPSLVPLRDLTSLPDGTPVIVSELPHDPSLSQWLGRGNDVAAPEALAALESLAGALDAAHAAGAVHGALDGGHVLVSRNDEGAFVLRLAGFGARHFAEARDLRGTAEIRRADVAGLAEMARGLLTPVGLQASAGEGAFFLGPDATRVIARAQDVAGEDTSSAGSFVHARAFVQALAASLEPSGDRPPTGHTERATPRLRRKTRIAVGLGAVATAATVAMTLVPSLAGARFGAETVPAVAVNLRPAAAPAPSFAPRAAPRDENAASLVAIIGDPNAAPTPPPAPVVATARPMEPQAAPETRPARVRKNLVWSPRLARLVELDERGRPRDAEGTP